MPGAGTELAAVAATTGKNLGDVCETCCERVRGPAALPQAVLEGLTGVRTPCSSIKTLVQILVQSCARCLLMDASGNVLARHGGAEPCWRLSQPRCALGPAACSSMPPILPPCHAGSVHAVLPCVLRDCLQHSCHQIVLTNAPQIGSTGFQFGEVRSIHMPTWNALTRRRRGLPARRLPHARRVPRRHARRGARADGPRWRPVCRAGPGA